MKSVGSSILFISAFISFLSCSWNEDVLSGSSPELLSVAEVSDGQSKIELGASLETLLNTDDVFSVFHRTADNEIWYYDGPDRSPSGRIKHIADGERIEVNPHIIAVSPFNPLNSIRYDEGVPSVNTSIPVSQVYNNGGFDPLSAILVACDEDEPIHFKYVCGFLELDLEGPAAISSIVLRGNDGEGLSGDVCVETGGAEPVIRSGAAEKSVVICGPGSNAFSIPDRAKILFCVAPQLFEKGVTYEITYESGRVQNVVVSSPVNAVRASIPPAHKAVCRDDAVLDICFLDSDGNAYCPFRTTIGKGIIPVDESGITSESAPVFLLSDEDNLYPFSFFVHDVSRSESLRITRSGLNIGGCPGDYIKFPGIDGMKLSRADVSLTGGRSGASFCLCGQDDRRLCDDISSENGSAYSVCVPDALEGEPVKMVLQREDICFIHSIRLRYE